MQTHTFDAADAASWLMVAHNAGERFRPFAAALGIDSLTRAYAVQREFIRLKQRAGRAAPIGYKIGLTSPSMQVMCGIDTPVSGVVLGDSVHSSGARLDPARYGRLGIEFEIAVRLGHDLLPDEPLPSLEQVADAVEAVAPAIEVVDDRGCDYATLDVLSLVADNAWNAGVVLGEFHRAWPDLQEVEGLVRDSTGVEVDRGRGSDVVGNPLAAVAWLASHLQAEGECLRAGQVIMTGSLVRTRFPPPGERLRFEVGGLGFVEIAV